jgi:hypothetical protein
MALADEVLKQYPTLGFLLRHPEVGPLLAQAVDPFQGFDPATFQAKLYQTGWWRKQSEAQRQWQVKNATDPGTARNERTHYIAELQATARGFGVHLGGKELAWIAESGLSRGLPSNHPIIVNGILGLFSGEDQFRGSIGGTAAQVRNMARDQWFKNNGQGWANKTAVNIVGGKDTIEALDQRFRREAAQRFPWLKEQLAEGVTLADIVDPYRGIVAEELELSSESAVDVVNSPQWRKLLGVKDAKTGEMRMPTESEVMEMARSQPQWWKTSKGKQSKGKQADASMVSSLLQAFGKRGRILSG